MRNLVGALGAALLVLGLVEAASAAVCSGELCDRNDTTISAAGGARPRIEVTSAERRSSFGPGAPGWVATCTHEVSTGAQVFDWLTPRSVILTGEDMAVGFDPSSTWVMVRCPDHPHAVLAGDVFALYEPADPPRRVVDLVVARAYGQTALPLLHLSSSPPGSEARPLLVHLETWLWVQGWGSVSATAALPGVTATVTAAPRSPVTWGLSGQGSGSQTVRVVCDGPGRPLAPRGDGGGTPDCTVTPDWVGGESSAEAAVLSLRVRWSYCVTCAPTPCPITLPHHPAPSPCPTW